MGSTTSAFQPFTQWSLGATARLLEAFVKHQMPFTLQPGMVAALIRTGDGSYDSKQAQHWASAICDSLSSEIQVNVMLLCISFLQCYLLLVISLIDNTIMGRQMTDLHARMRSYF